MLIWRKIISTNSAAIRCSHLRIISRYSLLQPPVIGLTLSTTRYKHIAIKNEKEKLRTYINQRYMDYVKNYTKFMEERLPTAMNMYRVFSVGIKDFLRDLKIYIPLRLKVVKNEGLSKLSRQEIELYQKMPSEMLKIAPVLILSAIPFGNYVIFPLAFWKPRKLLCSHFWSVEQQTEFSMLDLKERLSYNRPVLRALQDILPAIVDDKLRNRFGKVLNNLRSGVHPTAQDLLDCQDLFKNGPYHLTNLTYKHKGYLMKMHGLRKSLLRKKKLTYKAFLLIEMDKAIIREGGTATLSDEALRRACQLRGLNHHRTSDKVMRIWLDRWLTVTKNLDETSYSLVLHCPIFFGHNHPYNLMLIS